MIHPTGEGSMNVSKGGPATQEGKEVVRWNATSHSIRSPAPVVPGVEKREDWEEHRDAILESLQPQGHLEEMLAERVALVSWRLHRITRYETETIALSQERVEDDLARERRFGSGSNHPDAVRSDVKSAKEEHRLLKRFAKMGDDKPLSALDADSVIWDAMGCADKVAEGEVDPDEMLESVSVSGLPAYASWEGYEGWTAGLVRAVIEAVARATDEEPADPEDAPIRDPEGELQDFQEERRKVSLVHEFEEPTPEPAPSATEEAGAA